jgi:hypothetical protein
MKICKKMKGKKKEKKDEALLNYLRPYSHLSIGKGAFSGFCLN